MEYTRGEDAGDSGNGEGREPPERDVLELLGTKIPKYGILADKLILPMGYLYPVGNYLQVWVIWLPVPIWVWVRISFDKTCEYYPQVTHRLPMSSLRLSPHAPTSTLVPGSA